MRVRAGQLIRITDVAGQVGDLFAFARPTPASTCARPTPASTSRLFPGIGEPFVTTAQPYPHPDPRHVAWRHDMLIAACDPERYRARWPAPRSCAENLRTALADLGLTRRCGPQPVNVFMNIPVGPDGELSWLPAVSRPGDAVTFEAPWTACGGVRLPHGPQPHQRRGPTHLRSKSHPTHEEGHMTTPHPAPARRRDLGPLELANRLAVAPMTRVSADARRHGDRGDGRLLRRLRARRLRPHRSPRAPTPTPPTARAISTSRVWRPTRTSRGGGGDRRGPRPRRADHRAADARRCAVAGQSVRARDDRTVGGPRAAR